MTREHDIEALVRRLRELHGYCANWSEYEEYEMTMIEQAASALSSLAAEIGRMRETLKEVLADAELYDGIGGPVATKITAALSSPAPEVTTGGDEFVP